MDEYDEAMSRLLESRDRRAVKRQIAIFGHEELQAELRDRQLSDGGETEILRDRLLRALFKEIEPDNKQIPWYDWDVAGAQDPAIRLTVRPRKTRKSRKTRAAEAVKSGELSAWERCVLEGENEVTSSAEQGEEEDADEVGVAGRTVERESLETPEPPVVEDRPSIHDREDTQNVLPDAVIEPSQLDVPTTVVVTTASSTSTTTSVAWAIPLVARPNAPITQSGAGIQVPPRLEVTAEFANYLQNIRHFEYYSARLVRGMRSDRGAIPQTDHQLATPRARPPQELEMQSPEPVIEDGSSEESGSDDEQFHTPRDGTAKTPRLAAMHAPREISGVEGRGEESDLREMSYARVAERLRQKHEAEAARQDAARRVRESELAEARKAEVERRERERARAEAARINREQELAGKWQREAARKEKERALAEAAREELARQAKERELQKIARKEAAGREKERKLAETAPRREKESERPTKAKEREEDGRVEKERAKELEAQRESQRLREEMQRIRAERDELRSLIEELKEQRSRPSSRESVGQLPRHEREIFNRTPADASTSDDDEHPVKLKRRQTLGDQWSRRDRGERIERDNGRRRTEGWSAPSVSWDSASDTSRRSGKPRRDNEKTQAVKLIKSWGLKFSGEERGEDPEEFLEQLRDCRDGSGISDLHLVRGQGLFADRIFRRHI